jgi:hypothetical protein
MPLATRRQVLGWVQQLRQAGMLYLVNPPHLELVRLLCSGLLAER